MEIRNIPESQRRELAAWTARRTYAMMQDPQIRKEFEIWKAERKEKGRARDATDQRRPVMTDRPQTKV